MHFRCPNQSLVERWTLQAAKNDLYWGKDVRLACKDGVDVFWSRLLLSTWTKVVSEDTELIVFPDFDSQLVVKALCWSARGKVRLERKDMSDFYDVLLALGNYRQVETNTIEVNDNDQLVELVSDADETAKRKRCKERRRKRKKAKTVEEDSTDSGMSSDDSSDDDIAEVEEEEESIVATAKKVILGNVEAVYGVAPAETMSGQRIDSTVAMAVNSSPQQLDDAQIGQHFIAGGYSPSLLDGLAAKEKQPVVKLPKLTQDQCEMQAQYHSSNVNDSQSKNIGKHIFNCVFPGCSRHFGTYYHLKRHFVVSHYAQDLIAQFGMDRICKICNTTLFNDDTKMENCKRRLVVHYGLVHKKVLDFASEAVLKVFKGQNYALGSCSDNSNGAISSSISEKKKKCQFKEESDNDYVPTTSRRPGKVESTRPCLVCPSMFQTNSSMLGHMSNSHYHDSLIDKFGDGPICILCSSNIYDAKKDKNKKSWKLCYHYGVRHGRLLEVAPQEVKEQLKAMGMEVKDDIEEQSKKAYRVAVAIATE